MIDAQHDQTQASLDLANSSLDAANAQLENAQAQYNLTAQNVQQQNTPNRVKTWGTTVDLPSTCRAGISNRMRW